MFPDDTALSAKAQEVAKRLGADWRAVAQAVELCVECNVPVALQDAPGVLLARDEALRVYALKARKQVDELGNLEQRLAVMEVMLYYAGPGVQEVT